MHPRLGQVLALGALVCALAAGAFAQVDSNARIVRLSFVQGDVRIDRPGAEGLDTAFLNMPVIAGSRIVTGADGYAELEFEAGGTVRLTPNSELNVRELGLRGDNKVSLLDLTGGTAYFNVKQDSDDDFRVMLSGQELRAQKSSRFRIRLQRDTAEIAVTKGELQLAGGEHDVRIKKNETLLLDFQDRGRYFLAKNVAPLSFDTWDQERDAYRERYIATSSSYRGYSNSYSYGVSDLNYYGSYINMPGYGYVWRPYGYDIGWDPFMDGAWVWYPGYGYTWVSGYSWGWMPYRYGRWIFLPRYGWVWQPGNSWHRWNTCSTVYNPPHYYRRPTPPVYPPASGGGHGGGGRVVVVGKGAYHGSGMSDPRFRKDDGDNARVRGSGTPVSSGATNGGSLNHGSANNGAGTTGVRTHLPSVLAPGVDPNSNVTQELRRVHGDDLGLPARARARGRSEDNDGTPAATVTSAGNASTASNPGTTTTTTGNTTGGATTTTTTVTTTTVATPAPAQPAVVSTPPARGDNGSRPAPAAESTPASTRSTSGYTPRSSGGGGGASSSPTSTYHPPSSSSGSSSSGSSRTSSPPPSSRSTSSSSSGHHDSSSPPKRDNNPK